MYILICNLYLCSIKVLSLSLYENQLQWRSEGAAAPGRCPEGAAKNPAKEFLKNYI